MVNNSEQNAKESIEKLNSSVEGNTMQCVKAGLRDAIIEIAGERGAFDTRQSWLARAARRAGISVSMATRLFHEYVDDPKTSIVERVRSAVVRSNAAIDAANRSQENMAKNELNILKERIEYLERRLASLDTNNDGAGPHIDRDGDMDASDHSGPVD